MSDAESMETESLSVVLEEMGSTITRLRQEKYLLERKIRQLGRAKTTLGEIRDTADVYKQALVEITWADDLVEAHTTAQNALYEPLRRVGAALPQPPIDNKDG